MTIEKSELIADVLEGEAEAIERQADVAFREMHEHTGAEQALHLMSRQMPSLADKISQMIEKDDDIAGETGNVVLKWTRNVIARIQTMCTENRDAQQRQKEQCRGRIATLNGIAKGLRKKAETGLAKAARQAELEDEVSEDAAEFVDAAVAEAEDAIGPEKSPFDAAGDEPAEDIEEPEDPDDDWDEEDEDGTDS